MDFLIFRAVMRVLMMSFKVPLSRPLSAPSQHPKIVNMDDVKRDGARHPTSVLYKLLLAHIAESGCDSMMKVVLQVFSRNHPEARDYVASSIASAFPLCGANQQLV